MTSGFPVTKTLSSPPAPFKRFREAEQTEGNLFQNLFSTLGTLRALHNIYNPTQTGGNENPDICCIGPALIQPSPTAAAPIYRSPSRTLTYHSVGEHSAGIVSLEPSYGRCGFRATGPSTSSSSTVPTFPLGLEERLLPSKDVRQPVAEAELREFVCRLCGRDFKCALHLAEHHCPGIVQATYNCCECEKVFTCSANLASHQRWHRPKLSRPSLPILRTSRHSSASSALTFKHRRQAKQPKPPASPVHQQGSSSVTNVTDFSIESLLRPDRKQQQEGRRSGTSWTHSADSPASVPAQAPWSPPEGPQKLTTGCDRPSTCFCCGQTFKELGDLEDHILDHIFLPTIC